MPTIGPDNKFPFGEPINRSDRGGLYASFAVLQEQRLIVMNFGTTLDWVGLPAGMAGQYAQLFRQRVFDAFGELPYDVSTLPLRVKVNRDKQVVEIHFPSGVSVLVANPEVFLALAERLENAAKKLGYAPS